MEDSKRTALSMKKLAASNPAVPAWRLRLSDASEGLSFPQFGFGEQEPVHPGGSREGLAAVGEIGQGDSQAASRQVTSTQVGPGQIQSESINQARIAFRPRSPQAPLTADPGQCGRHGQGPISRRGQEFAEVLEQATRQKSVTAVTR